MIGRDAFAHLSLKMISIPVSVVFLDQQCFFDCSQLSNVVFMPVSMLEVIGESAFGGRLLSG
jgi:hypothetical protein